jgi:hypothetical protein
MPQRAQDIYASAPMSGLLADETVAYMPDLRRCAGSRALLLSAAPQDEAPNPPYLSQWVTLTACPGPHRGRYTGQRVGAVAVFRSGLRPHSLAPRFRAGAPVDRRGGSHSRSWRHARPHRAQSAQRMDALVAVANTRQPSACAIAISFLCASAPRRCASGTRATSRAHFAAAIG